MHRYGILSFTDVIVKSSNVGAIKIGLKLGPERLGRYVSRFGFGQHARARFPRRESPASSGTRRSSIASALASVSMGYQVGVTPLQMAAAVSSIANGGDPVRAAHRARADQGRTARRGRAQGRAPHGHPERTAAQLTAIMEAVVERGTAQVGADRRLHDRRQDRHRPQSWSTGATRQRNYNASFVGFVPSRKPALTIIVVIDSPHGKGYTGGAVAAPVFKRIAEASLRHLGIAPTVNAPPPVLVGAPRRGGLALEPVRASSCRSPTADVRRGNSDVMPDLRGLSAREAVRALARPRADGAGDRRRWLRRSSRRRNRAA